MVVDTLDNLELETRPIEARTCLLPDLECDMVLQENVRTASGMLLVAKGTQINYALLARLRNFLRRSSISGSRAGACSSLEFEDSASEILFFPSIRHL
jgi:hypothetical protein